MKQSTLFAAAAGLALSVVLLQGCKGSNEQNMSNMEQGDAAMSAPADAPAAPAASEAPAMPETPAAPAMPEVPAAPAEPASNGM